MSDGDHATPGRPRPEDNNGDGDWITRSRRQLPGAAPWERRTAGGSTPGESAPGHRRRSDRQDPRRTPEGSSPTRHRAEPEPEPSPKPSPAIPSRIRRTSLDTTILPALDPQPSELPDLAAPREPHDADTAAVAPAAPPQRHRRARRRRAGRRARAGVDRRRVAVAVRQEQPAQQGLCARPGLPRHRRPERPVRRRELPHRRHRHAHRRQQRNGRGHHRGRGRRPFGHRDAGEHPRQPQAGGGSVVPPRSEDRADEVRGLEPRDPPVRADLRRGDGVLGPGAGLHRVQAELGIRRRWAEMPGEGHPEALRPAHQPLHGGGLRRLLEDGRRARRRRGVQHDAASRTTNSARCCPRPAARSSTGTPR